MNRDTPFLGVRGISKRFPGVTAVHDVTVEVRRGETVGLVGPNGAGKSTLIKMLAGAVRPDEGEILIDGRHVHLDRPDRATQLGMAFVHQELADVPALTVAENVFLGLGYPKRLGVITHRPRLLRATRTILESLDCDIDPGALVAGLSVAQQRLVMIARGLAANAQLLVLDEPTASLTDTEIQHLHAVIRRIVEAGTAVVYVSHRLEEIFALTNRVVVMRNAEVVADVPTETLDRQALIAHIVGHPVVPGTGEGRSQSASGVGDRAELLRVENLSADAIADVSFALHAGEILGVAGLVGAGRTELVRLIFGADRPSHGRIIVLGESVRIRSPRDALEAGIVLLPEDRRSQGLALDQSVRENITLPSLRRFRVARWLPVPRTRAERVRAQELISDLGIRTPGEQQRAGLLSGGNQQKVVLAKWLAHGARIFIFDEPTHGVDVGGKSEIHALMMRLAREGNGVIFISSEFEELEGVCGRVLVIREGRLVEELLDEEVTVANMLQACFGHAAPSTNGARRPPVDAG